MELWINREQEDIFVGGLDHRGQAKVTGIVSPLIMLITLALVLCYSMAEARTTEMGTLHSCNKLSLSV